MVAVLLDNPCRRVMLQWRRTRDAMDREVSHIASREGDMLSALHVASVTISLVLTMSSVGAAQEEEGGGGGGDSAAASITHVSQSQAIRISCSADH
jgi:hypothetical protein